MKRKLYSSNTESNKYEMEQKSEIEIFTKIINDKGFSDFIDLFEYDNLWEFFIDNKIMGIKRHNLNQFLFILNEAVKANYSNYVRLFTGKVIGCFPHNIEKAFETAYETMKLSFYNYNKDLYM